MQAGNEFTRFRISCVIFILLSHGYVYLKTTICAIVSLTYSLIVDL